MDLLIICRSPLEICGDIHKKALICGTKYAQYIVCTWCKENHSFGECKYKKRLAYIWPSIYYKMNVYVFCYPEMSDGKQKGRRSKTAKM